MKNNKGFIELITVEDYWNKLQFDYQQLKNDKDNVYLAFNFFVTAWHLIDWVVEGRVDDPEKKKLKENSELKICGHIANGIKHFETDRHSSVKNIENLYVEKEYWEEEYVAKEIVIYHNETDIDNPIKISYLADKIMGFWEKQLNSSSLIK